MSRPANRAKTHFLKNVDLSSILEPADPSEAAFTATKGTSRRCTLLLLTVCDGNEHLKSCKMVVESHAVVREVQMDLPCMPRLPSRFANCHE